MSEEELNQELSTDELKNVAGGAPHITTWGGKSKSWSRVFLNNFKNRFWRKNKMGGQEGEA